ncbi:hormogonium polysaccharide biosynthesis protein HpsA [Lusitaniella coriacea]|uniref:hormogonium polysaccharide biosynthesis protein HpsA n=1 Tax=Lusitaniella coriacea TaxID=1983105 RepID=UPI003CE74467
MSRRKPKKSINIVSQTLRQAAQALSRLFQSLFDGILRRQLNLGRQRPKTNAGFILPTVVMVMLVVTLLVLTIVFRSFDRAKNASNVRVSQVALESATPAVARSTEKLKALFSNPRLPRATPSDDSLYNLLSEVPNNDPAKDDFTYEDEVRLNLAYDLNGNGSIQENKDKTLEERETINTAWRFPVDTDNNGKFDSFTVYSILFRTPAQEKNGDIKQERQPLESRTPPMDEGLGAGVCEAALSTSAKLVSQGGWYKSGSKLKKSFFIYTATIPITNIDQDGLIPNIGSDRIKNKDNYENSTETQTFSALEYQQDQSRVPLANFAVVFDDDLAIVSGTDLFLNGSVLANSNLYLSPSQGRSNTVELYQVSAPKSCFYTEENSKIFVGGQLVNSPPAFNSYQGNTVKAHLFREGATPNQGGDSQVKQNNQSVQNEAPDKTQYNNQAYVDRIDYLVDRWIAAKPDENSAEVLDPQLDVNVTRIYHNDDPKDVQDSLTGLSSPNGRSEKRKEALFDYFKARMRRVPYDEVSYAVSSSATGENFAGKNFISTGDRLRPPKEWMFPYEPTDGRSEGSYAKIALNIAGNKVKPEATEPETLSDDTQENHVGDRILIGNSLPAIWYKMTNYGQYTNGNDTTGVFVQEDSEEFQPIQGKIWDTDENDPRRTRGRLTRQRILSDVGDTGRSGFWEEAAATQPETKLDPIGGLRVITGAGIYDPEPTNNVTGNNFYRKGQEIYYAGGFTPPPNADGYTVVWPDTMPSQGNLKMRATAVYHYARDAAFSKAEGTQAANNDGNQKLMACVSSYYDPTNATTARNRNDLSADVSGEPNNGGTRPTVSDLGWSNNGIVYNPSFTRPTSASRGTVPQNDPTTGLFGGAPTNLTTGSNANQVLAYQANLVFPDGRFVNEPLRRALLTLARGKKPSLSEQASIDSTLCAWQILNSPTGGQSTAFIEHGVIKEAAFLNSRQVKTLEQKGSRATFVGEYDLAIEERQPLEIRVTMLNLDKLRKKEISFQQSIDQTSPSPEFMLPNSGIIYASRDDALPDISAAPIADNTADPADIDKSAVDYQLDPTRRPNGVLVYNGERLGRGQADNNSFKTVTPGEAEKGLTFVSNLPAYIWAWSDANNNGIVEGGENSRFNAHTQNEFTDSADFLNYNRNNLNPNFACRKEDSRLPGCTTGDRWRPANILADSVALLSKDFRFGFRNEGDFDLRNNIDAYPHEGSYTPYLPTTAARQKRKQNGFFDNNYVTNGLSSRSLTVNYNGANRTPNDQDYTAQPNANNDAVPSSYFTNFVTPIQRRRNNFSEYVMETCRKTPVSACQPNDWVIAGYDASGNGDLNQNGIDETNILGSGVALDLNGNNTTDTNLPETTAIPTWIVVQAIDNGQTIAMNRLGSGTTAQPPISLDDQHFPRRVAFVRDQNNQLALTDTWTGNSANNIDSGIRVTPIALGRDGANVGKFGYDVALPDSNPDNNLPELWFKTTNNGNGQPATGNETYNNDHLRYKSPATEMDEFLLPDVLNLSQDEMGTLGGEAAKLRTIFQALNGYAYPVTGTFTPSTTINSDKSADFAFCIDGTDANGRGRLQAYTGANLSADCNGTILGNVETARTNLMSLNIAPISPIAETGNAAFVAGKKVNVYQFTNTNNTLGNGGTETITLERGTQEDPIFVLRANGNIPITFNGVALQLNGVNPNNVFWVSNSGMKFQGTNELAGNFIGNRANNVDNNLDMNVDGASTTAIRGGRFLGFYGSQYNANANHLRADFAGSGVAFNAITTQFEPLLEPVLQLHDVDTDNNFREGNIGQGANVSGTKWLTPATDNTEFHILFAGGNTPTRPERTVSGTNHNSEPDGGIANFPRLLENWLSKDLRINGSMMEFERSKYATGPFRPLEKDSGDAVRSGPFNYLQRYKAANLGGRIPYNEAPNRLYGYDVALLTQTPDLFSSRFTGPPAGDPDEFFREVSRDDDWVRTLLCAKTHKENKKAVNDNQRPIDFCKKRAGD